MILINYQKVTHKILDELQESVDRQLNEISKSMQDMNEEFSTDKYCKNKNQSSEINSLIRKTLIGSISGGAKLINRGIRRGLMTLCKKG